MLLVVVRNPSLYLTVLATLRLTMDEQKKRFDQLCACHAMAVSEFCSPQHKRARDLFFSNTIILYYVDKHITANGAIIIIILYNIGTSKGAHLISLVWDY